MKIKETLMVRALGFWKIPLIAFVRPKVMELSDERTVVRIPLKRRTKNHLNSMYFGVLSVGADVAGGIMAFMLIRDSGEDISLVFKDFQANFLRRPTEDVDFICNDGQVIKDLVGEAMKSGQRVDAPICINAVVPSRGESDPVATFVLTLSLKKKRAKK